MGPYIRAVVGCSLDGSNGSYMVYTSALMGLLYHDSGAHIGTNLVLGPFGRGQGLHTA